MKKIFFAMLAVVVLLTACGQTNGSSSSTDKNSTSSEANATVGEQATLKVASLIPPMTDILELVKPILAEQNINLEVVVLGDNVQPNVALQAKEVDANFFQHVPYMEQFNTNNNGNLVPVVPIYFANYGVYAKNYDAIADIPDGAVFAIANDVSNIDRSLKLLAQHKVITLKETTEAYYTQVDIIENPKNIKLEEVDLLMLARMYDDADAVIMTPAYAKPLNLTPNHDALLTEGIENDFAITLVAREDNANDAVIQALAKAMHDDVVKAFLEENYADTSIPAF